MLNPYDAKYRMDKIGQAIVALWKEMRKEMKQPVQLKIGDRTLMPVHMQSLVHTDIIIYKTDLTKFVFAVTKACGAQYKQEAFDQITRFLESQNVDVVLEEKSETTVFCNPALEKINAKYIFGKTIPLFRSGKQSQKQKLGARVTTLADHLNLSRKDVGTWIGNPNILNQLLKSEGSVHENNIRVLANRFGVRVEFLLQKKKVTRNQIKVELNFCMNLNSKTVPTQTMMKKLHDACPSLFEIGSRDEKVAFHQILLEKSKGVMSLTILERSIKRKGLLSELKRGHGVVAVEYVFTLAHVLKCDPLDLLPDGD